MVCKITCLVSIVFLFANIIMSLKLDKNHLKDKFISLLNIDQKKIYEEIILERRNIYLIGYGIGIILSIIYYYFIKVLFKKVNNTTLVCSVGFIVLLSNYFYYILSKKSKYMIEYLNNKEQVSAWLNIYKSMQFKYHFALLLGIVASMLFAYSFRC